MNEERFKSLIEAYGANPDRWPQPERDAALKFAQSSPQAQRALDEAALFDRMLDAADTAPVTRDLEARILAKFPERKAALRTAWLDALIPARAWAQAAVLAASLGLGLLAGAALPGIIGLGDAPLADPALIAFSDVGGDLWDDLGDGS